MAGQQNAFRRAIAYHRELVSAMAITDKGEARVALSHIGPYVSHGHGKNKPFIRSAYTAHRHAGASKYQPHQGKQECARRVLQAQLKGVWV